MINDEEPLDHFEESDHDDENWALPLPKLGPISKLFYPFDSEEPFKTCSICNRSFDQHTDYLIEKAIKGSDVIFELAICLPCAEDMRKQLSAESLERIDQYMAKVDFGARTDYFFKHPSDDVQEYVSNCLVSGKAIDKEQEHQLYGYCRGNWMIYATMPYAISGEIMEEIQDLLSAETKQAMDDFMDQYLIPDDLRDLLKGRPVLL